MEDKIQSKLEEWAEKAYSFYYPKAKELDMDFYTQSDLTLISEKEPVRLMVIGINPGLGGRFQANRFAQSRDILHGNVCDGKHVIIKEMQILKKLRSILEYSANGKLIDDERTFVFTNATFFSTHKENGLNGRVKEAQNDSIEYTKKLIEIIQPKHIICLGGENCINLLVRHTQPLLSNTAKLEYGVIGNIPVYGINHTSGCYWSTEEMELVGKALGKAFAIDSKPIDLDAWEISMREPIKIFIQKRNDKKEIKLETDLRWKYIYTSLCNYCKYTLHLEESEKKNDSTRFFVKDSDGENRFILALVNQKTNKSIGVRYLTTNQPKDKDFETIVSLLQSVDGLFKPTIKNDKVIWIGSLKLNVYSKDTDKYVSRTKHLLNEILCKLSEVHSPYNQYE
ncbi:MAG: hypothetical protein SPK09_05015 [Porphyromonas sp.]|nr:hypothetical protein [Porphyromonas sp.]